MRKLKTILLSIIFFASLSFSTNALAATVSPNYIDFTGYEYVHSTGSTNHKEVSWQHLHTNPLGVTASVSYAVSRTKYSNANVSVESSFNVMVTKVGVSAEVGWGKSSTETTTVTWYLPANSTYLLRYGNMYAQASGTENYWSRGNLISSKSVSGKWTYMGWSDSIKQ